MPALCTKHEAPARMSSESTSKKGNKGCTSRRSRHHTRSPTHRNKDHKSSEADGTVSMSDNDSCRKALRSFRVEYLELSESDSNHSIPKARHETHKRNEALKVIGLVNDCYKEVLDFHTYPLANTASQVGQRPPSPNEEQHPQSLLNPFPSSHSWAYSTWRATRTTSLKVQPCSSFTSL